jgi:hypothetical protein
LLCIAAASLIGFAAFADGPLALTVDTIASWDSENGLGVGAGDDGFFAEIKGTYEAEKGGALFRLRTFSLGDDWSPMPVDKNPDDPSKYQTDAFGAHGPVIMDRYEAWIKPNQFFKVSIGNEPVELYNEEIKWDVPFGAGIFEGGKHVFAEFYPVDGLSVAAGVGEPGFSKDIQDGLAAWVTYDIACVGNLAVEYESLGLNDDGKDRKRVGAQFNYNGIDDMAFLVGYSTVLQENDDEKFDLAQHRVAVDFHITKEEYEFEVFNEAILRNKDYGDFGNRFATKFSYFLNDTVTPWLRAQCFMNYGTPWDGNAVAWSECQVENVAPKDDWLLVVEPRVTIDLGKGVSTILGATVNYASYDLAADKKLTWSIPVEFIVAF